MHYETRKVQKPPPLTNHAGAVVRRGLVPFYSPGTLRRAATCLTCGWTISSRACAKRWTLSSGPWILHT